MPKGYFIDRAEQDENALDAKKELEMEMNPSVQLNRASSQYAQPAPQYTQPAPQYTQPALRNIHNLRRNIHNLYPVSPTLIHMVAAST